MKLQILLTAFILLIMPSFPSSLSQTIPTCLNAFSKFEMLTFDPGPDESHHTYQPTLEWYGDCILIGATGGIWLYDATQSQNMIQLVDIKDSTVNTLAVNPKTLTIGFSIPQEPTVYLFGAGTSLQRFQVSGDRVTEITFVPGGDQIAVASSVIADFEGSYFYYDARVEIWNSTQEVITTIARDVAFIQDVAFTDDEHHILWRGINPGYIGDEIEYWDLENQSLIWTYSDLMRGFEQLSVNDPLVVTMISAAGETLAIGGLSGYHDWDDYLGTGAALWDLESGTRFQEITINNRGSSENDFYLTSLDLSFNGKILATAQNNGNIRLWDIQSNTLITEEEVGLVGIYQLLFSPDNTLISVLNNEEVLILDASPLQVITSFQLPDRT